MHRYTQAELATPAPYDSDESLATLARRVAEAATHLNMPVGERKRLALAGGMAEAVHAAVEKACDETEKANAKDAANRSALTNLSLPVGWTITVGATHADLIGPRDEGINASLSRHGTWLATDRVWRVPVSAGLTLARSLKRQAGPAATAARADKALQRRRADVLRWLGYVEEKAPEGYLYQRGVDECRSRTVADFPDLAQRLEAAIAIARTRAAEVQRERDADRARERAARETEYAKERAQRAEAVSRRVLHVLSQAPVIGRPVRLHGTAVVYTSSGQPFRVTENHPSIWGSHLLGHEGEPCAYYYYRPANETEAAELVASEAHITAQNLARQQRAAEVAAVIKAIRQATNLAPQASSLPSGLIVDGELNHYGGGHLLLATDSEAWYIEGHGSDGDDWSHNNLPGAVGWRVDNPEILGRVRALVQDGTSHQVTGTT